MSGKVEHPAETRTVWKYFVAVSDEPTVHAIPKGDVILHVADQGGVPTMWLSVNPEAETVLRTFVVTGTGHRVPPRTGYIGTAVGFPFVWHIWEILPFEFDGGSDA